jgi:hypothetical protein
MTTKRPDDRTTRPRWSAVEIAAAIALSRDGRTPAEVAAALEEIFGTRRTIGAVSNVVWQTRQRESRSRGHSTRSRLVDAMMEIVTGGSETIGPATRIELGRVPGIAEIRDVLVALGAHPDDLDGEPDHLDRVRLGRPKSPATGSLRDELREIRESLSSLRAERPGNVRNLARALRRALLRACANQDAVADAHLAAELRHFVDLPNDPTEALKALEPTV